MNKKIISCATICLLLLSCLSGCGKKKAEEPTEDYSINLGDNSMIDDASSDVPLMKDGRIK